MRREDLHGTWAIERESEWPSKRWEELAQQANEQRRSWYANIRA
jgi:hypothetical protein